MKLLHTYKRKRKLFTESLIFFAIICMKKLYWVMLLHIITWLSEAFFNYYMTQWRSFFIHMIEKLHWVILLHDSVKLLHTYNRKKINRTSSLLNNTACNGIAMNIHMLVSYKKIWISYACDIIRTFLFMVIHDWCINICKCVNHD